MSAYLVMCSARFGAIFLVYVTVAGSTSDSFEESDSEALESAEQIENVRGSRRKVKILNLSPKNGSIIWASGDICNVDLRFEAHGGTISFVDRSQMVGNVLISNIGTLLVFSVTPRNFIHIDRHVFASDLQLTTHTMWRRHSGRSGHLPLLQRERDLAQHRLRAHRAAGHDGRVCASPHARQQMEDIPSWFPNTPAVYSRVDRIICGSARVLDQYARTFKSSSPRRIQTTTSHRSRPDSRPARPGKAGSRRVAAAAGRPPCTRAAPRGGCRRTFCAWRCGPARTIAPLRRPGTRAINRADGPIRSLDALARSESAGRLPRSPGPRVSQPPAPSPHKH